MTQVKRCFYTERSRPQTKGEKFDFNYSWSWYDEETGEKRTDSENQFEKMQSYPVVTAQELVDNFANLGEIPVALQGEGEEIFDLSGLDNYDLTTIMAYVANLSKSIQEMQEALSKGEADDKTEEASSEVGEASSEVGEVKGGKPE